VNSILESAQAEQLLALLPIKHFPASHIGSQNSQILLILETFFIFMIKKIMILFNYLYI